MSSRDYISYWISRYGFVLIICGFLLLVISALAFLPKVQSGESPALATTSGEEDGGTSAVGDAPPLIPAILNVASDVEGSTVLVDFDSVGVTPLYGMEIEPGVKIVSMRSGGAQRDTVIVLESDESRWIYLSATKNQIASTFGVDETPPSARPNLQAVPERTTQSTSSDVPARRRTVPSNNTATVQPQPRVVQPPAVTEEVQTGSLFVDSTPPGARVILNGVSVGTTPISLVNLPVGAGEVVLSMDGYVSYSERINIGSNQRVSIASDLSPFDTRGTVSILVRPWGSIYIDGKLRKRDTDQEFTTKLEAGTYLVTVVHPKLGTKAQTITVEPGRTNAVVLDF